MARFFRYIIVLAFLATMLAVAALFVGAHTLRSHNEQPISVHVPSGSTLGALSNRWQADGWLPNATLLKLYARLFHRNTLIKAGEYKVPVGINSEELLVLLSTAKPIRYSITFIEGKTLAHALSRLANESRLKQDVTPLNYQSVQALLGLDQYPEGMLYPDTYTFERGERVSSVLQRAHLRLNKQLDAAWQQRAKRLPYQSPYEALIMASIVEKETGAAHERADIAAVFVSRLYKNMRLETDPTVIYGASISKQGFDGNLTRRHLRDRSNPYNTYRQRGLPPTPIALAGRAAINAALNPSKIKALYFVAKGDGTHQFSTTLADHNRAVRQYQKHKRRANYRSAPKVQ